MKIKRVIIRNFRSIKELEFEPGDLCTLIGENHQVCQPFSSGKGPGAAMSASDAFAQNRLWVSSGGRTPGTPSLQTSQQERKSEVVEEGFAAIRHPAGDSRR